MIEEPMTFPEAIEFILEKDIVPESEWEEKEWRDKERDVALRAFFSAKVEEARFLDRMQSFLFDTLAGTTEKVVGPDGVERVALRGGDRATFILKMQEAMLQEGMMSGDDEFQEVNQSDITDIRSEARLKLIYDTNMRQAYGYGQWKQGQHPAILKRFPAQRLVRDREVREPRERHALSEGEVRLKSDKAYWAGYQNDPEIGGFSVPWPPFGFNSGMGVQDVDREEAQALGLKVDDIKPAEDKGLNAGLKASTDTMGEDAKEMLRRELQREIDAANSRGDKIFRDQLDRAKQRSGL